MDERERSMTPVMQATPSSVGYPTRTDEDAGIKVNADECDQRKRNERGSLHDDGGPLPSAMAKPR